MGLLYNIQKSIWSYKLHNAVYVCWGADVGMEEVDFKASFICNSLLNLIFSGAILSQKKCLIFSALRLWKKSLKCQNSHLFTYCKKARNLGNIPLDSIQGLNLTKMPTSDIHMQGLISMFNLEVLIIYVHSFGPKHTSISWPSWEAPYYWTQLFITVTQMHKWTHECV